MNPLHDDRIRLPDAEGHFGRYGGRFVAETLMHPLEELRIAYERYREEPTFLAELEADLRDYVGRPSPSTMPNAGAGSWAVLSSSSSGRT